MPRFTTPRHSPASHLQPPPSLTRPIHQEHKAQLRLLLCHDLLLLAVPRARRRRLCCHLRSTRCLRSSCARCGRGDRIAGPAVSGIRCWEPHKRVNCKPAGLKKQCHMRTLLKLLAPAGQAAPLPAQLPPHRPSGACQGKACRPGTPGCPVCRGGAFMPCRLMRSAHTDHLGPCLARRSSKQTSVRVGKEAGAAATAAAARQASASASAARRRRSPDTSTSKDEGLSQGSASRSAARRAANRRFQPRARSAAASCGMSATQGLRCVSKGGLHACLCKWPHGGIERSVAVQRFQMHCVQIR